jgi:outer membrane protein OmpA-like peptidoglycan-associated protein
MIDMMRFSLIAICLLTTVVALAQPSVLPKKYQQEWNDIRAKAAIARYDEMIPRLEKLHAVHKGFLPAGKLLAESYMAVRRFEDALRVIDPIVAQGNIPEKEWLAMKARAHAQLRQYPDAINTTRKLSEWPGLGLAYQRVVMDQLAKLEFTWQAIQHPVPFKPYNLGPEINTEFFELYPQLSPDGEALFFTRKERNEDLYVATWQGDAWGNVRPLSINTHENEGAHSVSADGRFLFFTACNRAGGLGSCDIFYALKTAEGWTKPAGIGAPINSTDWESQPCFTANGMAMLFSSNRPNGLGGKDLYISYLDKFFKWQEPQNLGPEINTPGDEETPFLHADGRTLFFSSNGHPSVGGKDLYISRLGADGKWSKPQNLGYPINTEEDESGLFVLLDGKTAFLASDRPGGFGQLDIYRFELNEEMRAAPATYVKAAVKHAVTKLPLQAEYRMAEVATGRLFAEGFTSEKGELLIAMPVDLEMAMQVDRKGFVFYSENFQAGDGTLTEPYLLEVLLQPVAPESGTVLKNVFFAFNSHTLEATSFPELDKIVALLQQYPDMKAEISGHTDNSGQDAYNLQLSQKRAESVVAYLVSKGISAQRLTAKGFGSTLPIADNSTEAGRAENRRTEMRLF